jgi:hypothetical protein
MPPQAVRSERVPGRASCEFEISKIGSEPQSQSGTDWHHDRMAISGRERRHPETADEIGRACNTEEAIESPPLAAGYRPASWCAHRPRIVKAKRGALPEQAVGSNKRRKKNQWRPSIGIYALPGLASTLILSGVIWAWHDELDLD